MKEVFLLRYPPLCSRHWWPEEHFMWGWCRVWLQREDSGSHACSNGRWRGSRWAKDLLRLERAFVLAFVFSVKHGGWWDRWRRGRFGEWFCGGDSRADYCWRSCITWRRRPADSLWAVANATHPGAWYGAIGGGGCRLWDGKHSEWQWF